MPRRREPTISHASSLGYQHWGQTFNLFDLLLFYDKTRVQCNLSQRAYTGSNRMGTPKREG